MRQINFQCYLSLGNLEGERDPVGRGQGSGTKENVEAGRARKPGEEIEASAEFTTWREAGKVVKCLDGCGRNHLGMGGNRERQRTTCLFPSNVLFSHRKTFRLVQTCVQVKADIVVLFIRFFSHEKKSIQKDLRQRERRKCQQLITPSLSMDERSR